MRKNKFIKKNFGNIKKNYLDFSTCKNPESYDGIFPKKPDNYGNDITHNRTIIFDAINLNMKKDLEEKREKLIKTKNTKKPTDIIIFTDYDSISAASLFIKGFQQTGGAIVVGYFGNPYNNNLSDSSVSSSGASLYDWTEEYKNLINLNFSIIITNQEIFGYNYNDKNPIPQEYLKYNVDSHVNIYEDYNDDIYHLFIEEAKYIFDNYSNYCNINNKFLLLENSKCKEINGDKNKHGGFSCGSDSKWNVSNCKAFYCDLGYYYDAFKKKCIEDICLSDEEDEIPFWVIMIIIGTGIIVLIIALFLIKRTVNYKKSKDENEILEEEKLIQKNENKK